MQRILLSCVAGLVAIGCLDGQYPGQTTPQPYPPGGQQVPPGQYPGGSYPGGGRLSIPRHSKKKNKTATDDSLPVIAADGLVVSNSDGKLVVKVKDGRWLTMTVVPTTQWLQGGKAITPGTFTRGAFVHVEAAEDDEAFLTAKTVALKEETGNSAAASNAAPDGAKPASDAKPPAPEEEELSKSTTVLHDSDEPADRPRLRRGKPAASETQNGEAGTEAAPGGPSKSSAGAPAKDDRDAAKAQPSDGSIDFTIGTETHVDAKRSTAYTKLIEQSGEWAKTFSNGLPNFLCDQITTRYSEQSKAEGFQPVDIVTAKVLYEDGKEKYSQITVGGKHTNKTMMELGGSTSTGEFASTLQGLFEHSTHTDFTFRESSTVDRKAVAIYDLRVALVNSNWTIRVGGQTLLPEYTGSVWVEKATGQVRRIEMQAEKIPHDFPFDMAAMTVDYDEVSLGTAKFLLPVHSENLSCERGTSRCSKNTIDFRDYHKYSGESTIEFH